MGNEQRYKQALEEIREIYAGLEGMRPVTAAEGYLMLKLTECYDTAVGALSDITA